nr:MAG TPA: hypothetical protein [Caudoviricetes sp.]
MTKYFVMLLLIFVMVFYGIYCIMMVMSWLRYRLLFPNLNVRRC